MTALGLGGCPWIGAGEHFERRDVDGDGWAWPEDCDETDGTIHPTADEHCDGVDENCNGVIDDDPVDPATWYRDADEDGHGDPKVTAEDCVAPLGFVALGDDCDDTTDRMHPGLSEICNDGLDNDCDGTPNDCEFGGSVAIDETDFLGLGEASGDFFGFAVAVGDFDGEGGVDLAIAAPYAMNSVGRVYVHFAPLPADLSVASAVVLDGEADYDHAGLALGATDLGGEGHDTLLIGAPNHDGTGAVYLLTGITSGSVAQDARVPGGTDSRLGQDVVGLGDVTGDGYGDFAAVAPGAAYLEPPVPDYTVVYRGPAPSGASAVFGLDPCEQETLADGGDPFGSGERMLLIGAPNCEGTGRAWAVPAAFEGYADLADAPLRFTGSGAAGMGLGGAGDLDGDGGDDIVIGAPLFQHEGQTLGAVWVYTALEDGAWGPDQATAAIVATQADSFLGYRVAIAGDVNGDGFDDLLIGAPTWRVDEIMTGAAFLFHGPVEGDLTTDHADAVFLGPPNSLFGLTLAPLGDLDGDGYDDFLIGAPGDPGRITGWLGRGL